MGRRGSDQSVKALLNETSYDRPTVLGLDLFSIAMNRRFSRSNAIVPASADGSLASSFFQLRQSVRLVVVLISTVLDLFFVYVQWS
jgi:hypothetical protein